MVNQAWSRRWSPGQDTRSARLSHSSRTVRRARRVQLTAAGEARHAAVQVDLRRMAADLLDELSAAEQRSLLVILLRLARDR